MKEILKAALPPMSHEDVIAALARGDRDTVIRSHIGLVVSYAKALGRLAQSHLDDLVSEGLVGLTTAVNRFDAKKGAKLSTYAGWLIRQRMLLYLTNNCNGVLRIPEKVAKALKRASDRLGRRLTTADTKDDRLQAALLSQRAGKVSDGKVLDGIPAREGEPLDLSPLLSKLTLKERDLVERFYFKGQTNAQIARAYRWKVRTVKYQKSKVLKKLRGLYEPE